MNHSFDVEIATRFGVYEAVFIENLRFWVHKNQANNKHFYDGKHWTYNSAKAFAVLFPYWSKQQVERLVSKLRDAGVINIGHYSQNTHDRTNWYSLNEELLPSKPMAPFLGNDECTNTYIKPNTNTVIKENSNFETFWKAYPKKVNKGFARTVFNKLKPTDELMRKMIATLEKQIPLWKDPQYIPNPSTWLNGERWDDEVVGPKSAADLAYEEFKRSMK